MIEDSFYGRPRVEIFRIKQISPNSRQTTLPCCVCVDLDFRKTRGYPRSEYTQHTTNSIALSSGERNARNSPIDEGWRLRRLQHDAGQIDVAPAFDVELRIAVDLCLRDCTRIEQSKVKVVFGRVDRGSARRFDDQKESSLPFLSLLPLPPEPRSMITISRKTAAKLRN